MGIFNKKSAAENVDTAYFNKDAERQQRLLGYKATWEAYLAELDDSVVREGPADDNVKVNPARAIVNTGVYFLFGSEIKFQVSPEVAESVGGATTTAGKLANGAANPEWLKHLNRTWKANRKKSLLYNLGLSGAIHGDVFIKMVPNGAGLNNEYCRLDILDPANVDVFTDPNDYNKVTKFLIEYITEIDEKPVLRIQEIWANMDEEGRILNWSMQDFQHDMEYTPYTGWYPSAGVRVPVGPEVIWPFVWAPIEHCQNIEIPHMFWGLPDLDPSSVDVIKSLQRAMSSLNKIIRIHASPRMFAKNVMPDQIDDIDVSADNIITLPNMDAELDVLEMLSNISPSVEFTDKLREDLYEMLQVPPIALGKFETASTSISGVTLSILYAPLLQKTELKRISYGDMLERLNHKILMLEGYTDPAEYEGLNIVWPESMPGSTYLERQTLETDQSLGLSKYTTVSRMGYDPKEEQELRMQEVEEELKLQQKYAPKMDAFGNGQPGGNNNPAGKGNKNGSLGGVKAAGTPKTPDSGKNV